MKILPKGKIIDVEDQPVSPGNFMTRRYVLALAITAVLAIAAFFVSQQAVDASSKIGEAVNLAARQRILAQSAELALQRLGEDLTQAQRQTTRSDLIRTLDLLEQGHLSLSSGRIGLMNEAIHALYESPPVALNRQMRDFIADARAMLTLPENDTTLQLSAVQNLMHERANRLIQSLDIAVNLYNQEGEAQLSNIRLGQIAVVISILATLLLEAVLIFRPMVVRVMREITQNRRISSELREARDGLEDEVKRRTHDLELARADAEQANRAKSRFLAHASHDLSQPLEAMNLFVGALERQSDAPKIRAITHDLRAAQRSMRQLLAALLDLSQIEAGVIIPNPEPLKLSVLFDQLAAEFQPQAGAKGLEFRMRQSTAELYVDRMLLERILRNLITNAVRYTKEGGVLLATRRRRGDYLEITVTDTGPGIPQAEMERIFEEFHQLDDAGRDKSEGLGLGLTIAQRMSQMIDGEIALRSRPGKGSTFSVKVPRALPLQSDHKG